MLSGIRLTAFELTAAGVPGAAVTNTVVVAAVASINCVPQIVLGTEAESYSSGETHRG